MAFAFYASDAAASPVVNSKSDYTTKKMESNSNTYSKMKARLDSTKLTSEQVKTNVANMIKAGLNVVDPVYQNDDVDGQRQIQNMICLKIHLQDCIQRDIRQLIMVQHMDT